MTDSRAGGQGSRSLNWGTNALDPNPLKYYERKQTGAKSCLIHLSGVANTGFAIVILLLAMLLYKPKPYHKFPLSYCKSAFIGNSLFHALTHYTVFWQSKQPIRRIFWEGCVGKKYTTKHFLVHGHVEKVIPHSPSPVKPSLACAAFCCTTCARGALISSESPCRGRGTPLQISATSFPEGSVQQQATKPGVSPCCVSQGGTQASVVAQELPWQVMMGYAGLSKGVHGCAIPPSYEEMFELLRMLEAAQLASMAWANVSLFLPSVVVVMRVCFRISVRQPALWTYLVRAWKRLALLSPMLPALERACRM